MISELQPTFLSNIYVVHTTFHSIHVYSLQQSKFSHIDIAHFLHRYILKFMSTISTVSTLICSLKTRCRYQIHLSVPLLCFNFSNNVFASECKTTNIPGYIYMTIRASIKNLQFQNVQNTIGNSRNSRASWKKRKTNCTKAICTESQCFKPKVLFSSWRDITGYWNFVYSSVTTLLFYRSLRKLTFLQGSSMMSVTVLANNDECQRNQSVVRL